MFNLQDIPAVSPALDHYTHSALLGEVWTRPDLSPRDRSIVTLAALIARNQSLAMPYYFNVALDNGVEASEISEIIVHLAFYSGWPNAMSAVDSAKDVFAARGVRADQLPLSRRDFSQLILQPRRSGRSASSRMSDPSQKASCTTPEICCLKTCGCVPASRHEIVAW